MTLLLSSASPGAAPRRLVWKESFPDPFRGWRNRFFFRFTNVESYYRQSGTGPFDYRGNTNGVWLATRPPQTNVGPKLRLEIKPSIGLEASYFKIGINSHIPRLTVRFIDRHGRVFAVSCVPRRPYNVYVPVAVRLPRGLRVIEFDGHGHTIRGWVAVNHIEVHFSRPTKQQPTVIHERNGDRCLVLSPTR
ncbi:MAG: hypothetical protein KC609_05025 [Myxococcales bacterium]|nr:hypothetical protein [Myxococcales bacterium]